MLEFRYVDQDSNNPNAPHGAAVISQQIRTGSLTPGAYKVTFYQSSFAKRLDAGDWYLLPGMMTAEVVSNPLPPGTANPSPDTSVASMSFMRDPNKGWKKRTLPFIVKPNLFYTVKFEANNGGDFANIDNVVVCNKTP